MLTRSASRSAIRLSRRVDSPMTAKTSPVTMPSTLATYTPDGIHRAGPGSVEPGVQPVERENFLAGGHDGAVHGVVGIEANLPGAPPKIDVVAHHRGRFHAVLRAVGDLDVLA